MFKIEKRNFFFERWPDILNQHFFKFKGWKILSKKLNCNTPCMQNMKNLGQCHFIAYKTFQQIFKDSFLICIHVFKNV
jgi:hypothetical protein